MFGLWQAACNDFYAKVVALKRRDSSFVHTYSSPVLGIDVVIFLESKQVLKRVAEDSTLTYD